ncbi:MAG: aminopeptidase P family protein [Acholeplasmataceae bacterium]|nr:aminopeptidase P family protein [Acholeplasmataceae bacterium]
MYKQRRTNYLNQVKSNALSLFFSGRAPQKSNDQYYPFSVNRNFFYLTGIDQENVVLLIAKGKEEPVSYLFIAENDPVKVLWNGAGLSFEEASKVAEIEIENIHAIEKLDHFIHSLLSTTRNALFGHIDTFYLDLERQSEISTDTVAITYAHQLKALYPFLNIISNQMMLAEQRMVKDAHEIAETKKAIAITEKGLDRIMRKLKPGAYEYQIEAEYNFVLNQHRVSPSFDTIAASGKNATVLHYVDNKDEIKDGTLILLDLGVKYGNYCSDITRVYPANGTFTERQKAVYEVVLDVNKKSIEWLKPGVTVGEFKEYGKNLLIEGAKKLGLIKEDQDIVKYYYHGLGHYLGLDVHDVGNYSAVIPEGALITVEPGLYIAEEGIGIRIEDDVYVTANGPVNLSASIIKEIKDIEAFMKK